MGTTNVTQMIFNSPKRPAQPQSVRAVRILAFALPLLAVSCAGVEPSAPAVSPQVAVPQAATGAVVPGETTAAPPNLPPPTMPPAVAAVVAPAPPAAQPTVPANVQPAKVVEPTAKAVAKAPGSPVPGAEPPKKEGVAPEVAQQKTPPLDLASLEQRLKDTKAIGVLTKISLKNQVDDLLSQFRAFYQGKLEDHTGRAPAILYDLLSFVYSRSCRTAIRLWLRRSSHPAKRSGPCFRPGEVRNDLIQRQETA